MERTFIMIKPDGVQRKLVSEIISRFELKGFTLLGLKLMSVNKELAEEHYGIHKERPFFGELVDFISSDKVVIMVLEGEDAIQANRDIMGATNPDDAEEGTIRKEFAESIEANSVHGSDSLENAHNEISFFFANIELVN